MIYFKGITDIEQAKLRYRKLAKQLHPDAGGTAHEFQKLQDEYNTTVERIGQYSNHVNSNSESSPEKELLSELGKLAQFLLKKQVPQDYIRQKIKTTNSSIKKEVFREIVDYLDGL
jgi:hypothetical protein